MIKKILSILLSLMMVLSVTAPFVFAETETGAQPDTAGAAEQGSSADDSGAGEEAADEGPAEQDDAAENGGQEETEGDDAGDEAAAVAKRTILLYDCGTDLETDAAMATYNLRQILKSSFSADEEIRFVIMTGGADKWHLEKEYLVFPDDVPVPADAVSLKTPSDKADPGKYAEPDSAISNVYNQIWEVKGADAGENSGRMVLVDGDGVLGDGKNAKRSMIRGEDYSSESGFDTSKACDYEWMNDPEVLKAFINYGVDNFPAERYDLILWDHGGGPVGGFCCNEQEYLHGYDPMTIAELMDALSDNKVVDVDSDGDGKRDGKFDFVDFDACLMSSVETIMALSDCVDYLIVSPETEPGYGQYYGPSGGGYTGWLDKLGTEPEMSAFDIGKIIVDDFIRFYDKESGDGSSQEGTLAVIDMNKLMAGKVDGETFAGALEILNKNFITNLNDKSYYDEFRSFNNSIDYSNNHYYDLGILLTQLSYAFDDLTYQDVHSGKIDDTNAYTEIANVLMGFIYNKDIVYARSTEGIRTDEQFYRDSDGKIRRESLGTSGLYICFNPLDDPEDWMGSYHMSMWDVIEKLKKDGADSEKITFLRDYLEVVAKYGILYYAGNAVSELVANGEDPGSINFAAVEKLWKEKDGGSTYYIVQNLLDAIGGGDDMISLLNDRLIPQMTLDAVRKDDVTVKPEKTEAGTGYTVTLEDIRKPAIDSVRMNIIAELPALKEFIDDPGHFVFGPGKGVSAEMKIGTVNGTEVFDVDPETQGYEAAVDWMMDPTSTWKLDPPELKWYALRDAEGKLHVTAADVDEKEIDIPAGYCTYELRDEFNEDYSLKGQAMKEIWHRVWLVFEKDDSGEWALSLLAFETDTGSYRLIPPEEYAGEYELKTVTDMPEVYGMLAPITTSSFMLTPDTVGKLKPEFLSLSEIGEDVADTDGDGKEYKNTFVVTNIFGYELDITDKMTEPGDDPEEVSYRNVSGNGNIWYRGSDVTSDFAFKRSADDATTFSHFTGISVDGNEVDPSKYAAESGSVIVKLSPEYLETLKDGKHRLTAKFDDWNGTAYADFTVTQKEKTDQDDDSDGVSGDSSSGGRNDSQSTGSIRTGDESRIVLWAAFAVCALLLLALLIIRKLRERSR